VSFANDSTPPSPEGSWTIIDSETQEIKSKIYIREEKDTLSGIVTTVVHKDTPGVLPVCEKCTDERKGMPVVGMEVLKGFQKEKNRWVGGTLLDPSNGKEYKVSLKLVEDGNKLKLKGSFFGGYKGSRVLGRTLEWNKSKPKEFQQQSNNKKTAE
jgi:uncharacterized protein (DUF2147 family)